MKLPNCQGCPCRSESQYYLYKSGKYVCEKAKNFQAQGKHRAQKSIRLTYPEKVSKIIIRIDQCRKELEASVYQIPQIQNISSCDYGEGPQALPMNSSQSFSKNICSDESSSLLPQQEISELKSLAFLIKEQTEEMSFQLKQAVTDKKYYIFAHILAEALQLEQMINSDKIFINYSLQKTWKEADDVLNGKTEESSALMTMKANQRYTDLLSNTIKQNSQKMDKLKHDHQEKVEQLERENIKLYAQLKKRVKSERNLMKKLKERDCEITNLKDTNMRFNHKLNRALYANEELQNKVSESDYKLQQKRDEYKKYIEQTNQIHQNEKEHLEQRLYEQIQQTEHKDEELKNTKEIMPVLEQENMNMICTIERLSAQTKSLTMEEFNTLSRNITGSNYMTPSKNPCLIFDLEQDKDTCLLYSIDQRLPNLSQLWLKFILSENEGLKTFMKYYFPNSVERFIFEGGSGIWASLDEYIGLLIDISSKVTQEFQLRDFEISQRNLQRILKANLSKKKIGFINCVLGLDSVLDLKETLFGSLLEVLDLTGCQTKSSGDWSDNLEALSNLANGLSQIENQGTGILTIIVKDWGFSKHDLNIMNNQYKANSIQIALENPIQDFPVSPTKIGIKIRSKRHPKSLSKNPSTNFLPKSRKY
ncbi:unnamed protein product [Moneuplotes crassus]|uniref:Uncharacterized protein n=1 Tax=Euplotes crassus TaxID=5936 RepID=A0AAD1U374_EUPCR|nr:unnamed protein product [Moneuplotes crassus]